MSAEKSKQASRKSHIPIPTASVMTKTQEREKEKEETDQTQDQIHMHPLTLVLTSILELLYVDKFYPKSCNYDLFIKRDLKLAIDKKIHFSTREITWDNASIPM
jgi:hypothetical protein